MLKFRGLALLALGIGPAFGAVIQVSVGSGAPFGNWPTNSGTFNTGSINTCGVSASCNETSSFSLTDGATGITIAGTVTFTTDFLTDATVMAEMSISSLTIDNPSAGFTPVAIVFLSDQFTAAPTQAESVAFAGTFANDTGSGNVNTQVQGALNFESGGSTPGVPGPFDYRTPAVDAANVPGPVPFSGGGTTSAQTGITQLIGAILVDVDQHSEVLVGDPFTFASAPEPAPLWLAGAGLAAVMAARRRKFAKGL